MFSRRKREMFSVQYYHVVLIPVSLVRLKIGFDQVSKGIFHINVIKPYAFPSRKKYGIVLAMCRQDMGLYRLRVYVGKTKESKFLRCFAMIIVLAHYLVFLAALGCRLTFVLAFGFSILFVHLLVCKCVPMLQFPFANDRYPQ